MYLDVTLTHDLSWSQHIATMVSKAHQPLGFIQRNLRGSSYECRETAYIILTRAQLEYFSSIWDPILTHDSDPIEKLQRKTTQWAHGQFGPTSVTQLLKDVTRRPLVYPQHDHHVVLLYKILHGLVNIPSESVDTIKIQQNSERCIQPTWITVLRAQWNSSPLWNSTILRTILQWKQLPASTAEADSLTTLKSQLVCLSP